MIPVNKKKVIWLFSLSRSKKRFFQIAYDSFSIIVAFLLALALRLETFDFFYLLDTFIGLLICIIATLFIFIVNGFYNNITRYVSISTAVNLAVSSAFSSAILLSTILLLNLKIPISVSLIFGMILCILMAGMRLFIRYLGQNISHRNRENVAIYGVGTTGIQLMDALRQNPNYSVQLFVDDNPDLDGNYLSGIDVINFNRAKEKFISKDIKTMFLAVSFNVDYIRQQILDILSDYPIKIKVIPSISKLIDTQFKFNHLKDIKIEDLLGREAVEHNNKLMAKIISNKTILVTGAGGSIGSELCRQIIFLKPKKLILLDISEFSIYQLFEELKTYSCTYELDIISMIGSVQDRLFIKNLFDRFKIDTIYHAAAYKHVPLMEQNVMQCVNNNIFGTLNVAELSFGAKVKNFILVSTDKAVNPTNFMGASKRIAEIICLTMSKQQKDTCFSIVRFGNVLGSSGSVVPLFKKQIESGGPITLTHLDVTRFFMTISEAVQLVIQAGSIAQGGEIFVLDMGKPIKILDLAKRMIYLCGKNPILNENKILKDNEIAIKIIGLRPGEKLFEELSYKPNLIGTIHPLINLAVETEIKNMELHSFLKVIKDAIINNDYHRLFENITEVCPGVSNINLSTDHFIKKDDPKLDKRVLINLTKKN
ncbi:nucleoside-diphosphate sugar epimerase/dehydratase [Alphaproteobacteria bacterium]|nr:nucleoside-diphosphate sugar epimerase/dehydratase [Alphaproteobacteria bacterium]